MKTAPSITVQQLKQAIRIKERIESLQSELSALLQTERNKSHKVISVSRGMSAAGRARIAAAQRARWAKVKGNVASGGKAPKRRMSAAARAKIAAAAKARWAKAKAAGKNTL